jgi:hypothetical protein
MHGEQPVTVDEVDQLLRNARLRDAMEPYRDEAFDLVDSLRLTIGTENDYLESLLEWERAPVLPIARWFSPELQLPDPQCLDDARIHQLLWNAIRRLSERRILLAYTDHLSDRELYCILLRDILPAQEKKLERRSGFSYWFCCDPDENTEAWLRYYATDRQRERWATETGQALPGAEAMPHPRIMPGPPPPLR